MKKAACCLMVGLCEQRHVREAQGNNRRRDSTQVKRARGNGLISNIAHNNERYGNLVTYFRAKGLVPPSSEGR